MNDTTSEHGNYHKLAELIKDVRVAMMSTVSNGRTYPAGSPLRTRPMYTQRIDPETFSGQLWFFSEASSSKVAEIETNDNVLLTYASPDKNRYVAVSGTAHCEHNAEKARELWNIHAKGWWPDGPESQDLILIGVQIESAEYWDGPSNMSYMIELLSSVVTGKRIGPVGEHGTVG